MTMLKTTASIFTLAAALAVAGSVEAQTPSLIATNSNILAYSEGPIPGISYPDDYFAYAFDWPALADDGTVFFRAQMEGFTTTTATSRAFFRGTTAADLVMLTRMSDPAPGLPGLTLKTSSGGQGLSAQYQYSPDGRSLWTSPVSGPGVTSTSDSALFGGDPASPVLVAREGASAPGTAGAVYKGNDKANTTDYVNFVAAGQFSAINRNGTVLFESGLGGGDTTPSSDAAVFTGPAASPGMLFRKGDQLLPGLFAGIIPSYVLQMDHNGRVLFDTLFLNGPGVDLTNDQAILLNTPGQGNSILVREGDPAPGTSGATFGQSDNNWAPGVSVNDLTRTGKYIFTANILNGDAVPGINDRGLWIGQTGGGMTLVSRSGDPAPGTDGFFKGFSTFFTQVNDGGRFTFEAQITGGTSDSTNDNGIWTGNIGGPLTLVARAGSPAPGTNGAVFDQIIGWPILFNDQGRIVFQASLLGGDVIPDSGTNNSALYEWDQVNGLWLLFRGGETVAVGPDVTLYPWTCSFNRYNNTDGEHATLTKDGLLAFRMHLVPQGQAIATVDLNCYPPTKYYPDADGDGYGDALATPVSVCANATAPAGTVPNNTDCNDSDPSIHPGAPDVVCDGVDNNCSGTADEGYVPVATSCGVGACAATGATSCVNGSVVNSCNPGTPQPETCNGIDDNCDGTIDNVAVPADHPTMSVAKISGNTQLSWSASPAATLYDVVSGSLLELRGNGGNYATLTQAACTANDNPSTTLNVGSGNPAAGNGVWYLVRPANCGGGGSYNEGVPSQHGSRDAGIQAGGYACP